MTKNALKFGCHSLIACGALAACAGGSGDAPRDVGNMAYPQPMPAGVISSSASLAGPRDTGNMAYPQPMAAGNLSTTAGSRGPRNTGNMAFPQPVPAGNLGTTKVQ